MRFSLLAPFLLLQLAHAAAVLAIDYGTDSFKASLVKPGVPFDVLINKDSKRKTPSLIGLRGTDRALGGEGSSWATRFPLDTHSSVKLLLPTSEHAHPALWQQLFGTSPKRTARGSHALGEGALPIEELLAHQFGFAAEMAQQAAGNEIVKDVVVAVPRWFGVAEREAIQDGLHLAGLSCLGLVNDGTAAAVNFAMSRSFPAEKSHHLFYDLGASALSTTVVSLQSALLPDLNSLAASPELKNVTQLQVLGSGHDVNVGGYHFDRLVRDQLVTQFAGPSVQGDLRAMAKLLKEAGRVKQVLSANTASQARVEGLINDIDFKGELTREQLEKAAEAEGMVPRFTQPIHDALMQAGLTIDQLDSVILIGGSSRVPIVQAAVASVVGEHRIAKNLNADEAVVMGAALYGAGLTPGFRAKDICVTDVVEYGVDLTYSNNGTVETEAVFPAHAPLGSRTTVSLRATRDFTFALRSSPDGALLFEKSITGLSAATANLTEEAARNATVKLTLELDSSSLVRLDKAVVILGEAQAVEVGSLDKLKGLLGKFGKKDPADAAAAAASAAAEGEEPVKGPYDDLATEELEALLKSASVTASNSTVKLTVKPVATETGAMTELDKLESRKRLRDGKAAEQKKLKREEARNGLEAYVYKARDLVGSAAVEAVSIPREREILKETSERVEAWLWDEGEEAETKELKAKKVELEKLVNLITSRTTEAAARPAALSEFASTLAGASDFLATARKADAAAVAAGDLARFTTAELDAFEKLFRERGLWVDDVKRRQDKVQPHEDPVFRVAELDKKAREIGEERRKLEKKKAPRRKKVLSTSSSSSSTTEVPSSSSSSVAGQETETPKVEKVKDEL